MVPVVVALLLLCVIAVLVWPVVRRRVLAQQGSVFDCELSLGGSGEPQWRLGLARCAGDDLEWFPRHGVRMRPVYTLSRAASGIRAQTRTIGPDGLEGHRVVRLEANGGSNTVWELVLDTDALTALLAWLEAAPPSVGRFRS